MRSASPSTIAVLPTPGSPISTGLFLVRRLSTWIERRISSSRPITGSSLPARAASVRSRAYFFRASYWFSAEALSAVRPLRRSSMAPFSVCGVTPALARMRAALVSFSSARASSSRSTVTKLSPAFWAIFSAPSKTRAVAGARYTCPAPDPPTFGSLARASSVCFSASRARPPALSMSPDASPSPSSSSTLRMCSGVNCWLPSRRAIACADCTKPRARSVNFSKFILCLHGDRVPKRRGSARESAGPSGAPASSGMWEAGGRL